MSMKPWITSASPILTAALMLSAAGCSAPIERSRDSGALIVFVSIPPQAWLVERIGVGLVDVHVMVGPGQEPHTFEPQPRQLAALADAAIYFEMGMPFERQVAEKVVGARGGLRLVDTSAGRENTGPHSHAAGEGHAEGDPHIWLSPRNLKIMAATIADALEEADPGNAEHYRAGLEALRGELDGLDARLAAVLAPYRGRSFYVIHPAFGRFGEAYGLRQVALEQEGKQPSPRRIADLIVQARADGARAVFVQPQFDRHGAEALAAAIGAEVVVLDPLAKDLPANLEAIAAALVKSFEQERMGQ
jgi:zinc transport system substrate-binding protein